LFFAQRKHFPQCDTVRPYITGATELSLNQSKWGTEDQWLHNIQNKFTRNITKILFSFFSRNGLYALQKLNTLFAEDNSV